MEFLADLWLAILLSAVFSFIASSIIHMVIPIHKGDYKRLPGEEEILALMRKHSVGRAEYHFPFCDSMKDMGSEEMIAKLNQGPVGILSLMPNGPWQMGKTLGQWFAYLVLVSVFVAYIASKSLAAGADYLDVFQITGATAVLAYGISTIPNSIWKPSPWSTTARFIFDGVVYGLLTAGTFAWLWPA